METQMVGRLVLEAAGPILPRRVLVVERDWSEAAESLRAMVAFAEQREIEVESLSRVHGREHITFPGGGRVAFRTIHSRGDMVFADLIAVDPAALVDHRLLRSLQLCCAAPPGPEWWVLAGPLDSAWVDALAGRVRQ